MGRVVCVCEIKHGIHYLVSAEPDKALGNKTVEVLFAQVCPTLCNHLDGSLLGSSVRGLLQANILEWVAILFSRRSSRCEDQTQVSHIVGRFCTI